MNLPRGDDSGGVDDGSGVAAAQPSSLSESDVSTLAAKEAAVAYRAEQTATLRLGLVVPHSRLLDALQNGWLSPPFEVTGHMLGAGILVCEPGEPGKHAILVRLNIDVKKLPNLPVYVFRDKAWVSASPTETRAEGEVWFWPGALPTSAITELSVRTNEERIRLMGHCRSFI